MRVSRIVEHRDAIPNEDVPIYLLTDHLQLLSYARNSVLIISLSLYVMLHSFTSLTLLAFAGNVACWGGLGHRTVGYLAEHYFTEDAAQFVKDLIKPTGSFDISDAAIWADGIRQRQHFTEGWHFIGKDICSA
jgi:hypothetical protein